MIEHAVSISDDGYGTWKAIYNEYNWGDQRTTTVTAIGASLSEVLYELAFQIEEKSMGRRKK